MHPFIKDQNERLLHRAHEEINYALKSLPDSAPITFEEFTVLKDKVSRRKLLANRKNAKKSTGPKTEEGKKRSSKNAIQHGLTAQSDITSIMLEYDGEFNSFQDAMFRQLNPRSQAEITLADRIVTLSWRLKRIPLMETRMIDWHCKEDAPHAAFMWSEARSFVNLSRYEGQLDRCLHRTYKKLEDLQANRNTDHFATRTKEIIEVEMVREKNEHIYIQERQREAKRKEKAQKAFEEKVAEYHSKNAAEDNQSQASHLAQARPALDDSLPNAQSSIPSAPVRAKSGPNTGRRSPVAGRKQSEKSETNPPNLNQVQTSTLSCAHSGNKQQPTSNISPTLSPPRERVGAGNSETVISPKGQRRGEGAKEEAKSQPQGNKNQTNPPNLNQVQEFEQSSMLPKPLLIQFVDEDESDSSDLSDVSDSPHEPRATVHAPRKKRSA